MFEETRFENKADARAAVWRRLREQRAARFPLPPEGRIPNFAGARAAAKRLAADPRFRRAKHLKVNPDAPQRDVRRLALEEGKSVYMPTPRLRGGFKLLDPARIAPEKRKEAASLSKADGYAVAVDVEEMPALDLIVTGAVAVTRDGRRCGKGEGFADLEYAVLRETGQPALPVVTTAHPLQVVAAFPADSTDLPLHAVFLPEETIEVADPPPAPEGIDWNALDEETIEAMPILRSLRDGKQGA